jgi:hypothetical protein
MILIKAISQSSSVLCSNLKHLDLSFTNLSGPIPHQLKNLSHLQYLNLGWNDLKINENPEWLSHLSSIEYLDLSYTNLNVSNDWLEVVIHLPKLTKLDNVEMCSSSNEFLISSPIQLFKIFYFS